MTIHCENKQLVDGLERRMEHAEDNIKDLQNNHLQNAKMLVSHDEQIKSIAKMEATLTTLNNAFIKFTSSHRGGWRALATTGSVAGAVAGLIFGLISLFK